MLQKYIKMKDCKVPNVVNLSLIVQLIKYKVIKCIVD